jgi:hypothetical protein
MVVPLQPDNLSGFDHGLLDSILALMVMHAEFLQEHQERLKPELFAEDIRIRLAEMALRFYQENGKVAEKLFLDYIDKAADLESFPEARIQLLKDKAADVMQASVNSKYVAVAKNSIRRKFGRLKSRDH